MGVTSLQFRVQNTGSPGLIISISVGGGNLMIHHAMWIWTQAVLLCAAFDADSKSDGSK